MHSARGTDSSLTPGAGRVPHEAGALLRDLHDIRGVGDVTLMGEHEVWLEVRPTFTRASVVSGALLAIRRHLGLLNKKARVDRLLSA